MPDVDNKKRRDLIMRMAMDVPKKARGDAHLTEGPVMRQGEPKDDEGLEDSLQADDLLLLGAPVLGAGIGALAKGVEKGLSPKVASMIRLIGKSGADLQSLKRANMNQRHSDSSLWMNDDYAAALGVPKNPAWQKRLTPDDIKMPAVPQSKGASSWPARNDDVLGNYLEGAGEVKTVKMKKSDPAVDVRGGDFNRDKSWDDLFRKLEQDAQNRSR